MSNKKTLKKGKYKVVIIGAGNIAAGYDTPDSKEVLTHAHAFVNQKQIDLVGFFDTNKKVALGAAKKWGTKALDSLDQLKEIKPDIISICTPTRYHAENLKQALDFSPKIVICEKPIASTTKEVEGIIKKYEKNKIPIIVNYSRRFDTSMQKARTAIQSGEWGEIQYATATYTKGLKHNGSHMIDLIRFLFGDIKNHKALRKSKDGTIDQDNISGYLNTQYCPSVHLLAGNEAYYTHIELDIVAEKKRVRFTNGCFVKEEQTSVVDTHYPEFHSLSEPIKIKTHLNMACQEMANHAIQIIEKGKNEISTAKNALETLHTCEILEKLAKKL